MNSHLSERERPKDAKESTTKQLQRTYYGKPNLLCFYLLVQVYVTSRYKLLCQTLQSVGEAK